MACLNVEEWTPDQVAEWMSGLGPSVAQYIPQLKARGVNGRRLLMLRCDDLEYLGMHVIGHQELLLEAVEHLRNFQYELSRECIQQLAMRVCVVATCVVRALGASGAGDGGRLETQALADVARAVAAVKPLAGWLDRWAEGATARERLLRAALEAAASAQRERFAERPARAVRAAAAAAAECAAHLARAAVDPGVLRPATLAGVTLKQGGRALGFRAAASPCARHQVCDVRFGSPAHASGAVHEGDEIVAVGARCVVGWGGAAVLAACEAQAARGDLALRLRRRAARPPRLRLRPPPPPPDPADSDDSGPLSPPASPTANPLDHTRIFLPRPQTLVRRRHSISGGSPSVKRPDHTIDQFWQQLRDQTGTGGIGFSPDIDDDTRDKAASCGGLEARRAAGGATSGAVSGATSGAAGPAGDEDERRARLDKAHSTPAYELDQHHLSPPSHAISQGAEKADQILDFKKSSSQIGEAMSHRRTDGDDDTTVESPPPPLAAPPCALRAAPRRRAHTPRAGGAPAEGSAALPVLRAVRPERPPAPSPLKHTRTIDANQISAPLRIVSGLEARAPRPSPPPSPPPAPPAPAPPAPDPPRTLFSGAKGRTLKKKNSLLARRRNVTGRAAAAAGGAGGRVWQRVRSASGRARWAARWAVTAGGALLAYRSRAAHRAAAWLALPGCAVQAAPEVRSRPHAFKVYRPDAALYFAAPTAEHLAAWLRLLHPLTLAPVQDIPKPYSETEYSDTSSEEEEPDLLSDRERDPVTSPDKDKSKFGSLKKLTGRMQRSDSQENVRPAATSLDRKYLRFFSRHKPKDDSKHKGGVSPSLSSRTLPVAVERRAGARSPLSAGDQSPLRAGSLSPLAPAPAGGLTLEQFMLQAQAAERRENNANNALIGTEGTYGEGNASIASGHISNKGKDGYEKSYGSSVMSGSVASGVGGVGGERWRDSLRRNDRVYNRPRGHNNHSWSKVESGHESGEVTSPSVSKLRLMFGARTATTAQSTSPRVAPRNEYPHLVCPPTFQAESYSLSPRPAPSPCRAPSP